MRFTRFSSALASMVVPRRFRFRFCDFLVRMWLWNALPRFTRPLAVTLKRLAEPRWLFILGILNYLSSPADAAAVGWLVCCGCAGFAATGASTITMLRPSSMGWASTLETSCSS